MEKGLEKIQKPLGITCSSLLGRLDKLHKERENIIEDNMIRFQYI